MACRRRALLQASLALAIRALLTGPAEAPDTSTSFGLQRRFESNFFRFCQYCSASFPFEIFNSLAISFHARCFMSSFLKFFSCLLYKQG